MRKETGIIIAAGVGLLAVIGIIGFRKFLSCKNREYREYEDYYNDHHQNFEQRFRNDEYHGVEYL